MRSPVCIIIFLVLIGTRSENSSVLRGIALRSQNSASSGEVAPRERVAIAIRSQLHACCQVETRRHATLVEMRREVRAACYRGTSSCYINLPEPWYLVSMQRRDHGKKQYNRNICLIVFSVFHHPVLARIHTTFRCLQKVDKWNSIFELSTMTRNAPPAVPHPLHSRRCRDKMVRRCRCVRMGSDHCRQLCPSALPVHRQRAFRYQ